MHGWSSYLLRKGVITIESKPAEQPPDGAEYLYSLYCLWE